TPRPGEVKLWDVASGQEKVSLKGHTARVNSVAFSRDGRVLASGSAEYDPRTKKIWGEVKVWDVVSGQAKFVLKGHTSIVMSVAFSPDGKLLASASGDRAGRIGEIKLWEVATGQEKATLKGHSGDVLSVTFSPDGKRIASGSVDGTIRLWDVATGR